MSNDYKRLAFRGDREAQMLWLDKEIAELYAEEKFSDAWYVELCDVFALVFHFDLPLLHRRRYIIRYAIPARIYRIWTLKQLSKGRKHISIPAVMIANPSYSGRKNRLKSEARASTRLQEGDTHES